MANVDYVIVLANFVDRRIVDRRLLAFRASDSEDAIVGDLQTTGYFTGSRYCIPNQKW